MNRKLLRYLIGIVIGVITVVVTQEADMLFLVVLYGIMELVSKENKDPQ